MNIIYLIFQLLVLFQIKHFICDFPLQGSYMLKKFLPSWDFFLPLLAHCAVHGVFTLAITLYYAPALWPLCLVDMGIHFTMDRLKAGPKYLGRYKALSGGEFMEAISIKKQWVEDYAVAQQRIKGNKYFWISLGFDQLIHGLTDTLIIFLIITQGILS